jgi:electron transport complex protein RnfG
MREMIKMVVVLLVLSGVSGGVLAALHNGTEERIQKQLLEYVIGPALREALQGASNDPIQDRFTLKEGETERRFFVGVYEGKANTVAMETEGKGYGDVFGLLVAINTETDQLVGVEVTNHKETPGLGARAKDDPGFTAQFEGQDTDQTFKVLTDNGQINAISGATITSRGVCAAVTRACEQYGQIKPQVTEKLQEFNP